MQYIIKPKQIKPKQKTHLLHQKSYLLKLSISKTVFTKLLHITISNYCISEILIWYSR